MAFHAQDGWFFERNDNGSVTMSLKVYYGDDLCDTRSETTFEPSLWASVVASVSKEGETKDTWEKALAAQVG